jgi:hypothetical protein
MNAKHTPGPWRADFATQGEEVFGFSVVAEHGPHWHPVAYQSTYQHTNSECYEPEERKANALLIAAAPELLSAVMKLRDEFKGLPHSLGYDFTHLPEVDALLVRLGIGAA